jgi:hypothetical protein
MISLGHEVSITRQIFLEFRCSNTEGTMLVFYTFLTTKPDREDGRKLRKEKYF